MWPVITFTKSAVNCCTSRCRDFEDEHGDRSLLGIDDPVFRNAGLGILAPLRRDVVRAVLLADDFDDQIGSLAILLLDAKSVGRLDEKDVGLPVLARTETYLVAGQNNRPQILAATNDLSCS